jgi:YidC/Oxa1 family membrane protein insertase
MFNLLLVKPFINLLILFYSIIPGHDFGLAIIALTVFVRLIIWPLQTQTLRSQKALQTIQPEIKKIQTKYKNDPQKMNQLMMELYKEKEVNPFSSCLPSLLQLPVMIALFYAFIKFNNPSYITSGLQNDLYSWVKNLGFVKEALSGTFSTSFLGLVDLAKPNVIFAVVAGVVQFIQTKMIMPAKDGDATQSSMSLMLYAFPILTVLIGLRFPAALPLYWIVTTAIAVLQQYLVMHRDVEVLEEEK